MSILEKVKSFFARTASDAIEGYAITKAREDALIAFRFSSRTDDPEKAAKRAAGLMGYEVHLDYGTPKKSLEPDNGFDAFVNRYISQWHTMYDYIPDNAVPEA